MKKLVLLIALITASPMAFAGNMLEITCGFGSRGNFTTSTFQAQSGMIESAQCPQLICAGVWDVTVNYNGNSYEDITLAVDNNQTGEASATTYHDVKVGTTMEFGTQNKKTGEYLTVECEVTKAQ